MIYKLETVLNDGEPSMLHAKDSLYIGSMMEYICTYYGIEYVGAYIDIPVAENMKRNCPESEHAMIEEEIMPLFRYGDMDKLKKRADMECFDAKRSKLMHAVENIGDEMTLVSGWNEVKIRIRGMSV